MKLKRLALVLACLLVSTSIVVDAQLRVRLRQKGSGGGGGAPTGITWALQSNPADTPHLMHFTDIKFNSVSGKIIGYLVPNAGSSIYASSIHEYTTASNDWDYKGGSTPTGNDCSSSDSASPTPWPRNRHPVGQLAVDYTRGRLHLVGGVCQSEVANGRLDHWYYDLSTYTWTQVFAQETLTVPQIWSNLTYNATFDMLVLYGPGAGFDGESWVHCLSATVNAAQIAAGCATAGTWYKTHDDAGPTASTWANGHKNSMFDIPSLNKEILFAKDENSGGREIWLYDIATTVWTQRTGTTGTPSDTASLSTGDKDHVRITTGPYAGLFYFHRSTRTSSCDGATNGYIYNYTSDAYSEITVTGGGPPCAVHLAWDETAGKVFGWSGIGGAPQIWVGTFN